MKKICMILKIKSVGEIKSLWVCEENLYNLKNKKCNNELLNNILFEKLLGKYIKSL